MLETTFDPRRHARNRLGAPRPHDEQGAGLEEDDGDFGCTFRNILVVIIVAVLIGAIFARRVIF